MQYYRCKCGNAQAWGSIPPRPCDGCTKCNTTLTGSPDYHETPQPHLWVPNKHDSIRAREARWHAKMTEAELAYYALYGDVICTWCYRTPRQVDQERTQDE